MSAIRTQQRYTVDEYEEMVVRGILTERDRVELIRGEIVDKMTIGTPHSSCTRRLNWLLGNLLHERALISIQAPIRLPDSEPEPDVSVVRPRPDFYAKAHPIAEDIFLVIEVSDSSLDFDRDVKGPLYAESGIVEYWIVNLIESCLEVHRRPSPAGTYGELITLRSGDTVEITALPGVSLAVSDILGV